MVISQPNLWIFHLLSISCSYFVSLRYVVSITIFAFSITIFASQHSRYFPQTRLPRHDFGGQRRTETRQKAVPRRRFRWWWIGADRPPPTRSTTLRFLRSRTPPWASAPFFGPPKPPKTEDFFLLGKLLGGCHLAFFCAFQYWSRFCCSGGMS